MKANEAHYQLWDRVITVIKGLQGRTVDDYETSVIRIKRTALGMMDVTDEEYAFIDRYLCCVLCAVQHAKEGRCNWKCPFAGINGKLCGDPESVYHLFETYMRRIGPDWMDDDDVFLNEAVTYAEKIRDVPLPEDYDRELSYYIELSNSKEV